MSASIDHCVRKLPVHHFWTQRCEMLCHHIPWSAQSGGPPWICLCSRGGMILLCGVCARFQAGEGQLCETAGLKEQAAWIGWEGWGQGTKSAVIFMFAEVGGDGEGGKGGYYFSIWGKRGTFWFADAWFINSSRHSGWVIAPLSLCLSWISGSPQIDALA